MTLIVKKSNQRSNRKNLIEKINKNKKNLKNKDWKKRDKTKIDN